MTLSPALVQAEMPCGWAFGRLRDYAAQVNGFALLEYRVNIPARCAGHLPCMNQNLARLNAWHAGQMARLRAWHGEIDATCRVQPPEMPRQEILRKPVPPEVPPPEPRPRNDGRYVRIEIPATPEGFR